MMQHASSRRVFGAAILSLGLLPLTRSIGATAQSPDTGSPAVTIDNFTFTPRRLAVQQGSTVVFANRDDIPHTVTSSARPPLFKSAPLDTGDNFSFTFAKPGIYDYFCSLHPHMQGTIVVK